MTRPRTDNWKSETMLMQLDPNEILTIDRPGLPPLRVTPRELMGEGRISGTLFIDQIEWAFTGGKYVASVG